MTGWLCAVGSNIPGLLFISFLDHSGLWRFLRKERWMREWGDCARPLPGTWNRSLSSPLLGKRLKGPFCGKKGSPWDFCFWPWGMVPSQMMTNYARSPASLCTLPMEWFRLRRERKCGTSFWPFFGFLDICFLPFFGRESAKMVRALSCEKNISIFGDVIYPLMVTTKIELRIICLWSVDNKEAVLTLACIHVAAACLMTAFFRPFIPTHSRSYLIQRYV